MTALLWLAGAALCTVGALVLYAWVLTRTGTSADWTPPTAHEIDQQTWDRACQDSATRVQESM
jgi:hypothetical protein